MKAGPGDFGIQSIQYRLVKKLGDNVDRMATNAKQVTALTRDWNNI